MGPAGVVMVPCLRLFPLRRDSAHWITCICIWPLPVTSSSSLRFPCHHYGLRWLAFHRLGSSLERSGRRLQGGADWQETFARPLCPRGCQVPLAAMSSHPFWSTPPDRLREGVPTVAAPIPGSSDSGAPAHCPALVLLRSSSMQQVFDVPYVVASCNLWWR